MCCRIVAVGGRFFKTLEKTTRRQQVFVNGCVRDLRMNNSIHSQFYKMAAVSVLNFAARSVGRTTIFTLKGHVGVNQIFAKVILPSIASVSVKHKQAARLHTSALLKQEAFELPKNRGHGAQHWALERAVAIGLLVCIPGGALFPHPLIDYGLAVMLPMHAYWGVNAVVVDYMWRPAVPATKALCLVTFVLAGAGLFYLNMYDVGICKFTASILRL